MISYQGVGVQELERSIDLSKKFASYFHPNSSEVLAFLERNVGTMLNGSPQNISFHRVYPIKRENIEEQDLILEAKKINEFENIDNTFRVINTKLKHSGVFIGCVETLENRHTYFRYSVPRFLRPIVYATDFIVHRTLPKLNLTSKLYNKVLFNRNRAISLAETLGRLVYCGFEIIGYKNIGGQVIFAARKNREPMFNQRPTSGLICKLKRSGKQGKEIYVYKLRTMHPYSEYIQDYLYEKNGLSNGDKIINDFRKTSWGIRLRKYWIDELPMFYNLLKGDMKLVGVRPLSEHKLSLYSGDTIKIRRRHKPGLIPPYYADMPDSLEKLEQSERVYLKRYERAPVKTDLMYLFRILVNIFFKAARSK